MRLRCSPEPPASTRAATRLTTIPTSATISTGSPSTPGGETSRRIASITISTPRISSVTPLAWADRISARPSPKVIEPAAGLVARRAAASDNASATASVSMWAASDSSASDQDRTPTTTSHTMKLTISTSAVFSALRSVSREGPWEWEWPCPPP